MARQYLSVEFAPGGRTYTYHNDGPPAESGDTVEVDARGERMTVTVVDDSLTAPGFPTKPILGVIEGGAV